jgi:hypothetical protein
MKETCIVKIHHPRFFVPQLHVSQNRSRNNRLIFTTLPIGRVSIACVCLPAGRRETNRRCFIFQQAYWQRDDHVRSETLSMRLLFARHFDLFAGPTDLFHDRFQMKLRAVTLCFARIACISASYPSTAEKPLSPSISSAASLLFTRP